MGHTPQKKAKHLTPNVRRLEAVTPRALRRPQSSCSSEHADESRSSASAPRLVRRVWRTTHPLRTNSNRLSMSINHTGSSQDRRATKRIPDNPDLYNLVPRRRPAKCGSVGDREKAKVGLASNTDMQVLQRSRRRRLRSRVVQEFAAKCLCDVCPWGFGMSGWCRL